CELLINTPAIAAIIREGKTHLIDNVIQTSSKEGMIYFESHLAFLYSKGLISREVARAYAIRPKEIDRLLDL
ncbi:MAG: twitching motility protein PilT, partial [Candidatus Roizmanbacteria bacterium]